MTSMSLKAFAEEETSASEPFPDRLDRMWDEGQLFFPALAEPRARGQLGGAALVQNAPPGV